MSQTSMVFPSLPAIESVLNWDEPNFAGKISGEICHHHHSMSVSP